MGTERRWRFELIRDLCAENNVVHCVDPFKAEPVYCDAFYWRLHGNTGYLYRYTEQDLAGMVAKLDARANLPGPSYVMS